MTKGIELISWQLYRVLLCCLLCLQVLLEIAMAYPNSGLRLVLTVVITISKICTCAALLKQPSNTTYPPRIWIQSYVEADRFEPTVTDEFHKSIMFENEYIRKNFSDYVIHSTVQSVSFMCEASYPITWKPVYPEQMSRTRSYHNVIATERYSEFKEELKEPRNKERYAFAAIITIFNSNNPYPGGYFTCESVQNPKLTSPIYVFLEGENVLENNHEKVTINVSSSSNQVILPCRPMDPFITVSLAKQTRVRNTISPPTSTSKPGLLHHNKTKFGVGHQKMPMPSLNPNSVLSKITNIFKPTFPGHPVQDPVLNDENSHLEWVPIALNVSVSFDPKRGFILDKNTLPDVFGFYKCFVAEEEEDVYTYVNVISGAEYSYEFKPKPATSSSQLKILSNTVMCCDSGTTTSVQGFQASCSSEAQCEFMKPIIVHDLLTHRDSFTTPVDFTIPQLRRKKSTCYTTYIEYARRSAILLCHGSSMDLAVQLLVGFKSSPGPLTRHNIYQYNQIYDITKGTGAIGVDQKIQIQFNTLLSSRLGLRYGYFPGGGILRPRFSKLAYYNYDILGRRSGYTIADPNSQQVYEGQAVQVICIMLQYFYSKGGWLRLNWRNGSQTVLEQQSYHSMLGYQEAVRNLGSRTYIRRDDLLMTRGSEADKVVVAQIEQANMEMESIDCFAPVWNSDKWDKKNFKLNIKTSSAPILDHPETETLHVKLGETGLSLNCTTAPTNDSFFVYTSIRWRKDGKSFIAGIDGDIVSMTNDIRTDSTTSSLLFKVVNHATQGEYQCEARRMSSNTTKTFKIYVIGESSHVLPIVLISSSACVGSLIIIAIVLTWRYKALHTLLSRLPGR